MLKFFRQLRKDQLMSDKTRKYVLYAIGEIFLVVIGILIALQINNWNENRQLRAEELHILKTLKTDLVKGYETGASLLSEDAKQAQILAIYLLDPDWKTKLEPVSDMDSLITNVLFRMVTDIPVIQVGEDLNNSGKSTLISNEQVRNKLLKLDSDTERLRFQIDDKLNIQQSRIDELLIRHFNLRRMVKMLSGYNDPQEPLTDLDAILDNAELANVMSVKLTMSEFVLNNRTILQTTIKELIDLIDDELAELS